MTTRAFGDAPFKQIGQISEPAIGSRTLGPGDRWLVLASDGVWDPLAAEVVAAIVRPEPTAEAAVDRLMGKALAAGDDNVSVVVVRL
jgi:serine/threonine protein phosphatase PrpC